MQRLSTFAFRNLRVRLVRTLLTIAGIVLGVAVVLAIAIANRSIYAGLEALFADVAGNADLSVKAASGDDEGFDQRILEQVQEIEGIVVAVPSTADATMLMLGDKEASLTVYGVDPAVDRQVRPYKVIEGEFLPEGDKYTVIVAEDFAQRHDVEVGEDVKLLVAEGVESFLVTGILAKEGPARQAKMVMPLAVSQEVFARGRNVDTIDVVAEEEIAKSADALDRLMSVLQDELGPSYEVTYPAAKGRNIAEMLSGLWMGLGFFAATALFVGAYLVFNTFSMTVVERTREIGLLRAVGLTRWQITRLVLTEAFIMGLAGSLLGLLFGLLLSVPMMGVMNATVGLETDVFSVPLGGVITSIISGMVVTIASALIPAIRAGRMSPVEALTIRGRRGDGWLMRHGWKVGLVLVVLSEVMGRLPLPEEVAMGIGQLSMFVLLGGITLLVPSITGLLERLVRPVMVAIYGHEGRIGASNVRRAVGRTSLTVGALTVGVLMAIMIGAMSASVTADTREWMETALRGDLFVTSFQSMRMELGQDLAAIAGVNLVTPMHFREVKVVGAVSAAGFAPMNEAPYLLAVDPLEYDQVGGFEFVSGQGSEKALVEQLAEGDALFISTVISQRYGIGKGDYLRLRTRRGEQDFVVAAVIVDYFQGGEAIMGSWKDLERYFRHNKAHMFMVDVAPDASVEDVQQNMEDLYGRTRHIEVESGQELRERWLKDFLSWFTLFDVIAAIGVIMGALGVINTLMMNVLERVREIGSLRSLGMTRLQVGKMILSEALVMGLMGGLLGVVFGAYGSYYAVTGMEETAGWTLTYILPKSLLLVGLIIALGVSQLAALYPAWRAARLQPIEALRYE
jgi:putative ABC transport system permease protein